MTKPKPRKRIPEREVDLSDQKAAMALLEQRRRDRGLTLLQLERGSGVSIGAYMAWRRNLRSPAVAGFLALAAYLGYEVKLIGGSELGSVRVLADIVGPIFSATKSAKRNLLDVQLDSGYSATALCKWRKSATDPSVFAMVALAGTAGFRIFLAPMGSGGANASPRAKD